MPWTTPAHKLDIQRGFVRKLRRKFQMLLLKINCNKSICQWEVIWTILLMRLLWCLSVPDQAEPW